MTRIALSLFVLAIGCHYDAAELPPGSQPDAGDGGKAACAAGHAGAACVIALFDAATAACDPVLVDKLAGELDARKGIGPLWSSGRALFRTARDAPAVIPQRRFGESSYPNVTTLRATSPPAVSGTIRVAWATRRWVIACTRAACAELESRRRLPRASATVLA